MGRRRNGNISDGGRGCWHECNTNRGARGHDYGEPSGNNHGTRRGSDDHDGHASTSTGAIRTGTECNADGPDLSASPIRAGNANGANGFGRAECCSGAIRTSSECFSGAECFVGCQ